MRNGLSLLLPLLLLLAACGSDGTDDVGGGDPVVVTGGATDDGSTEVTAVPASESAIRPDSPAELEQVILAFANCVAENEDVGIRLRYRTDPFVGMGEEAVIDDGTDQGGVLLEQFVERCRAETGLDDAANHFLDENPLTEDEEARVVADFEDCVGGLSTETRDRVADQQMVTLDALSYTGDLFDLAEYGALVQCRDEAFMGGWRVFGNESLFLDG